MKINIVHTACPFPSNPPPSTGRSGSSNTACHVLHNVLHSKCGVQDPNKFVIEAIPHSARRIFQDFSPHSSRAGNCTQPLLYPKRVPV